MNKMKNAKKGMIIAGVVLFFTLGIFIIKNNILRAAGFYWATPFDIILGAPMIPLIPLLRFIPNLIVTYAITIAFWLLVGYGIGRWMDKRKK